MRINSNWRYTQKRALSIGKSRIIVTGSLSFRATKEDELWLKNKFIELDANVLIVGMKSGAEMFAYDVAQKLSLPIVVIPCNCTESGNLAGPLRNAQMIPLATHCIFLGFDKLCRDMWNRVNRYSIPHTTYKIPYCKGLLCE